MKTRSVTVPASLAVCAALVLVPTIPAAAAVDTQTWTSPSDNWWTTPGAWSTGEAPEAGDTLVFSGPTAYFRSTLNSSVDLAGIQFDVTHLVANGGGALGLGAGGLSVATGADVTIESGVETTGTQTWTIAAGSTATFPASITTDGVGALTLDVDGTLSVNGNLDALGTGDIIKTGSGVLARSGGAGGGVGGNGLQVQEGTFLLDSANIAGTAFEVTGGTLAGVGTINALDLTSGVVAPGLPADPAATIEVWNESAWSGGTYEATIDGTDSDTLLFDGPLSIAGTELQLAVEDGPLLENPYPVIVVNGEVTGNLSVDGVEVADGDEFVQGAYLYRINYIVDEGTAIVVTYLGEAPVIPVTPVTPVTPTVTHPATGFPVLPVGAVALVLVAGGILLAARRRTLAS